MKMRMSTVFVLVLGLAVFLILALAAQETKAEDTAQPSPHTVSAKRAYDPTRSFQNSTILSFTSEITFTQAFSIYLPAILKDTTGYALQFDGVDDFVSIVGTEDFDFDNAFSVETWVKPLSLAGSGTFRALVQGAFSEPPFTGSGWVMYLHLLDSSKWGLSVCVSSCEAALSGSGGLQLNQWQHLAATYDGTEIVIYRNGEKVANTPQSGNVTDVNFVLLGIWDTSFNGLIDEVRIWNIARTQTAIQADMNRALTGSESGLVGYWRFEEGSGQTAFDSTSGHNDGRLGASPASDGKDPIWVTSSVPIQ